MGAARGTPEERFYRYANVKGENECWVWSGAKTGGNRGYFYGLLMLGGNKKIRAHRLSWELKNKSQVPAGMGVCHSCDVPLCVNPKHLFIGTQKDNARDMADKGRHWNSKKTMCKRSHPLAGNNVYVFKEKSGKIMRTCRECHKIHTREWARRERAKGL